MPDTRLMLDMMPLRAGLATAGKRSTIDERNLWACQNTYPDLDGLVRSRPGIVQQGQRLMYPDSTASRGYVWYEPFSDLSSWSQEDKTSDASVGVVNGLLTVSLSTGSYELTHVDTGSSAGAGQCTIRFTARITNPEGAETTGGELRVQWNAEAASAANARQVSITATGVGTVEADAYTHPSGEDDLDLDLGGYHVYEFRYTSTTDEVDVYVDDAFVYTLDLSGGDVPLLLTSTVRLVVTSGSESWTVELTDVMYGDVYEDALLPHTLVDVGQYERLQSSGATTRTLLAATTTRLYADIGERGAWRPILLVSSGHTRFLPYQDVLMIFDDNGLNDSKVYSWNTVESPAEVEDAPPVRFGTEHRTRLFAAGDRSYPLRLYFTASRQFDVWFSPTYDPDETFEEVTQAGFLNIPSETGDEITGLYGEYYGTVIVVTKRGIWRVAGSSPDSFQVDAITKEVGGESPDGMVQIGNDLFIVGRQGVTSVQTSQNYGDLQTGMPSGPIADVWSSIPSVPDRVDREQLSESYFDSLPSLNLAVLGMRGQGETTLTRMFAWSPLQQSWHGPWTYEPTCFKKIEFGTPRIEVLLSGLSNGYTVLTGLGVPSDLGEPFTTTYESPMLSGRSLDPKLTHRQKRWRTLRIYLLSRSDNTFTLSWRTDDRDYDSVERHQMPDEEPTLNNGFRLNVDLLADAEEVTVIEQTLDDEGRYLRFKIESDYDFVLQGYQVEFLPGDDPED